jgi:hypothetical protein
VLEHGRAHVAGAGLEGHRPVHARQSVALNFVHEAGDGAHAVQTEESETDHRDDEERENGHQLGADRQGPPACHGMPQRFA